MALYAKHVHNFLTMRVTWQHQRPRVNPLKDNKYRGTTIPNYILQFRGHEEPTFSGLFSEPETGGTIKIVKAIIPTTLGRHMHKYLRQMVIGNSYLYSGITIDKDGSMHGATKTDSEGVPILHGTSILLDKHYSEWPQTLHGFWQYLEENFGVHLRDYCNRIIDEYLITADW